LSGVKPLGTNVACMEIIEKFALAHGLLYEFLKIAPIVIFVGLKHDQLKTP
jgi:hypothetical protein